jgi:hypothetical protein
MKYYQLSYPRSGANWLRYIARYMLGIDKNYHLGDDLDDTYTKLHTVFKFSDVDYNRGLVLILRDYKECLRSHSPHAAKPLEDQVGLYFQCLATYHEWPERKYLVYYEELIEEPGVIIEDFSVFLTGTPTKGVYFLEDYEQHMEFSKAECRKIHACNSEGNKTNYHQQSIDVKLWDDFVMLKCPTPLRPYIEHYVRK